MEKIITPLDNIIDLVNELKNSNNHTRRGSTQDNTYDKLLTNVNSAKNNIIFYFSENQSNKVFPSPSENLNYAQITKQNLSSKKLIIPVSENTPNAIEISKTEERLADLIKKSNSKATVIKSNATEKGNLVFRFVFVMRMIWMG